jgi:hypothetical protein
MSHSLTQLLSSLPSNAKFAPCLFKRVEGRG